MLQRDAFVQPGHSLRLTGPNTPDSLSKETESLLMLMSWMHPTKDDVTGSSDISAAERCMWWGGKWAQCSSLLLQMYLILLADMNLWRFKSFSFCKLSPRSYEKEMQRNPGRLHDSCLFVTYQCDPHNTPLGFFCLSWHIRYTCDMTSF